MWPLLFASTSAIAAEIPISEIPPPDTRTAETQAPRILTTEIPSSPPSAPAILSPPTPDATLARPVFSGAAPSLAEGLERRRKIVRATTFVALAGATVGGLGTVLAVVEPLSFGSTLFLGGALTVMGASAVGMTAVVHDRPLAIVPTAVMATAMTAGLYMTLAEPYGALTFVVLGPVAFAAAVAQIAVNEHAICRLSVAPTAHGAQLATHWTF